MIETENSYYKKQTKETEGTYKTQKNLWKQKTTTTKFFLKKWIHSS